MADHSDHCLMHRIDQAKSALDHSQRRINTLERNLRLSTVVDDERDNMMAELAAIRKELKKQEKTLEAFHKNNRKTTLVVILIAFVIFMLYLLYKNY